MRMKILTAVLHVVSLVKICLSEDNCQRETETLFFVYNISTNIKTFYCSGSKKEDNECKNSNRGEVIEKSQQCNECFSSKVLRIFKGKRWQINACELSAQINLLDNTIKFQNNIICNYTQENCFDINISKEMYWSYENSCQMVSLLYQSKFSVWNTSQSQSKFIDDERNAFVLTEKIELCGYNVWKTNHKNIIASTEQFGEDRTRGEVLRLKDDRKNFCDTKIEKHQPVPRKWYIYSYPPDVTVYIHIPNTNNSCEDINLGQSVPKSDGSLWNESMSKFCDYPACNTRNSKIELCKRSLQINLLRDTITELPEECKYSAGICKPLNTFWHQVNLCDALQFEYEADEVQCSDMKCIVHPKNNTSKLMILISGQLCGLNVWYTNQLGFVASEVKLQPPPMASTSLAAIISEQNEEIRHLKLMSYGLTLFIVICVVGYLFNVITNFLLLKNVDKNQKKKTCLINCICESLTSRHLFLRSKDDKKDDTHLYVYVENDLCKQTT